MTIFKIKTSAKEVIRNNLLHTTWSVFPILALFFWPEYSYPQQEHVSYLANMRNINTYDSDQAINDAYLSAALNPDSAILLLEQQYRYCAAANYTYGMADALFKIGSIYAMYKRDYRQAQTYYRKSSIPLVKITHKKLDELLHWKGSWHNNMGVTFYYLDQPDSTVYHYEKALYYANMHNCPNTREVINTHNNLAASLNVLGQYKKALYYEQQAEQIAISKGKNEFLVTTYQNMATSFIGLQQYDSAHRRLELIDMLKIPEDALQLGLRYCIAADLYRNSGKIDLAIASYKKAVAVSKEQPEGLSYQAGLGQAYLLKGDYLNAQRNLETALTLTQHTTGKPMRKGELKTLHSALASVYDALNNFPKAYYHRTQASFLSDSIASIEKDKVAYEIEAKYRMAEKDKDIAGKKLELLSLRQRLDRKNLWIVSTVSATLILSFAFIVLYQRQRIRLHKEKAEKQQQQISQLSAVLDGEEKERARIGRQLHDDVMVEFSLAKINLAALPDEFPMLRATTSFSRVEQQLDKTGIKIRQTAHNLMPDALLTEGLLYAIDYFCNGISRTTPISIQFQFFGQLPNLGIDMETSIYRILQELIQNVVKHAQATDVLVQINGREQELTLTVEDNGKGIKDLKKAENGMGIRSIRSRLKVLHAEMDLRSVPLEGTEVHIEIPIGTTT